MNVLISRRILSYAKEQPRLIDSDVQTCLRGPTVCRESISHIFVTSSPACDV